MENNNDYEIDEYQLRAIYRYLMDIYILIDDIDIKKINESEDCFNKIHSVRIHIDRIIKYILERNRKIKNLYCYNLLEMLASFSGYLDHYVRFIGDERYKDNIDKKFYFLEYLKIHVKFIFDNRKIIFKYYDEYILHKPFHLIRNKPHKVTQININKS